MFLLQFRDQSCGLVHPLFEEPGCVGVIELPFLDEIINEAKLDYALGHYKTFTTARDLIAELHT